MKISRSQLAEYLIESNDKNAIQMVAAYLVENGRSKEVGLVIREVESKLSKTGRVVARVESARKLEADLQRQVIALIKNQSSDVQSVEIINEIDPSLLGGVVIRTPGSEVDLSIRHKLNKLKSA